MFSFEFVGPDRVDFQFVANKSFLYVRFWPEWTFIHQVHDFDLIEVYDNI